MAPETLIFVILTCLIFYFTFRKAEAGLYLLVVAILMSFWEVPINFLPYIMTSWYGGPVRSSLTINLADVVILALLLKSTVSFKVKEALRLLRLPLSIALILVLFASYLSIAMAAYRNLLTGDFLRTSIMYLLKFTEVILIYFIILFNVKNLVEIKRLVMIFVITGTLTAIVSIAIPWMGLIGKGFFDTRLIPGGFYCILSGICFSLMVNEKFKPHFRIWMEIMLVIFVVSIVICLKRSVYLGLFMTIIALLFMRPEKKMILVLLLYVSVAMLLSENVRDRIEEIWNYYGITAKKLAIDIKEHEKSKEVLQEDWEENVKGIIKKIEPKKTEEQAEEEKEMFKNVLSKTAPFMQGISTSLVTRYYSGRGSFGNFLEYPICGIGFWGTLSQRYQTHNAYLQMLSETGLIGFAAFLFMLFAIIKNAISLYLQKKDKFISDFGCGFLASFVGIMAMGIFSEIFTVFTLMQIVFFMTGMVVISLQILEKNV